MQNQIPHPTISPDRNLSKNTMRYVENTNKKRSFLLWQICQFNHYGWLILLKFDWFLNSNSQNLLLAFFLIRPILDPKFPLMAVAEKARWNNMKDEACGFLSLSLSLSLLNLFFILMDWHALIMCGSNLNPSLENKMILEDINWRMSWSHWDQVNSKPLRNSSPRLSH